MPEISKPIENGLRFHPLAQCEKCPLQKENSYVPSFGKDNASIVFVGETPGRTLLEETGPGGKLFDSVLHFHGLNRNEAFITSVCSCVPPSYGSAPTAAIKACLPRLLEELNDHPYKYIVTLGSKASQTVLGTTEGISSLRAGPPRKGPLTKESLIIPTVHPSVCLRSTDMFPSLVADIGKIVEEPKSPWVPPEYLVSDDILAVSYLEEIRSKTGFLVIDIETGYNSEGQILLSVGLGYAFNKVLVLGENACKNPEVRKALGDLLKDKKIIAHNGKFDLAGLEDMDHSDLWFDTMLASYVLDERKGVHGLKYLASELLGAPKYDEEMKKFLDKDKGYLLAPRPLLYKYNAYDVSCTYSLWKHFEEKMNEEERDLHDYLCEASKCLMEIEKEGILVDLDYLDQLSEEYSEHLRVSEKALQGFTGIPTFNPRSPAQVKDYLLSEGLLVESTDVQTLTELLESNRFPDFCSLMLTQRREQKIYGTYIKGIRSRLLGRRVFPSFLLHGTVSGRLACRNPNMQNVPRESSIRKQFIAAPGNIFIQGDYSQAELRVVATLAQDEFLKEVFDDPSRDIFDEVGTTLYGERAVGNKVLRMRTKAYVYGIQYGREPASIASEYKISLSEARRGYNAYLAQIPQTAKWREGIKSKVLSGEDLVTPFGRRRRTTLITRENRNDLVKEGLSFLPQSIASDICLRALISLQKILGGRGRIRLPVHDSILVECKEEYEAETSALIRTVMEESARTWFSSYIAFPIDLSRGKNWGELS